MKQIKIFLASSIDDLREDRIQIGDYFNHLNEIYFNSGIHFSLIKCEDADGSIVHGGKQSRYDEDIRNSDLCFFLFFRKVGGYTKHEFEVAIDAFKKYDKPKIVTYIKLTKDPEQTPPDVLEFMDILDSEYHHYYNTYAHIDTLKLGILMQIKLLNLDVSDICIKDGTVQVNGKTVLRSENVPMLNGNETLRTLTDKKRELQSELDRCRKLYLTDPSDENEDAFLSVRSEYNKISKKLTEVEKETLTFVSTVAELSGDGRVLTYRQREALSHFNNGEYRRAQELLEDRERENELDRAKNRIAAGANEIQGYVEEELLWIKAEKARGITPQSTSKICARYEKAIELTEQYSLDYSVFYDYASFLYAQNKHTKAIAVAEKLKWYYDKPGAETRDEDESKLLNLLGILYHAKRRFEKAKKAHLAALEIRKRMAAADGQANSEALAISYNNLGNLYSDTKQYAKAEEALLSALEIYKENPEANQANLARGYSNIGSLYYFTQSTDKAEEAYLCAIKITKKLTLVNPDEYEPLLAMEYNNLGVLYTYIPKYDEAEASYRDALTIYTRLSPKNPDAYEPSLAECYHNLGALYSDGERFDDSEEHYLSALEIRKRLYKKDPDSFKSVLASTYYNLGGLYYFLERQSEARRMLETSLELYRELDELSEEEIDELEYLIAEIPE